MAGYKIPSEPVSGFTMPFADEGQRTLIPDEQRGPGRASLALGFPNETQLPLSQGGIAPNRLDFQGILYMLSSFAFWQQSGGLYTYKAAYNYAPPAMVMSGGSLWWCKAPNGPGTAAGAVTPGTDDRYWVLFVNQLLGLDDGASIASLFGNPVGTVIMYAAASAPDGYLVCDGGSFSATTYAKLYAVLGESRTPDMRGMFVRGYDPAGVNDPDGAARSIRSAQGDAIRNITASWGGKARVSTPDPTGAVYTVSSSGSSYDSKATRPDTFGFDASRVVPTAAENRPKNITLLYCIKHD